jgi:hypothetical protein
MHPHDLKRLAIIAAMAVTALITLRPGMAKAGQPIACPVQAVKLDTAAPILGPVNGPYPWGELHSEATTKKDGTFVQEYDLAGGVATQMEKWMICHYVDGTYQAVKLPTATKQCRVASKPDGVDPVTRKPKYRVDITCS